MLQVHLPVSQLRNSRQKVGGATVSGACLVFVAAVLYCAQRFYSLGSSGRIFVVVSMALLDGTYRLLQVMRTFDAPPLRPERDPFAVPHLDLDDDTPANPQREREAARVETGAENNVKQRLAIICGCK